MSKQKTAAYFAEKSFKGARLEMAGNIIQWIFPDNSVFTILVEDCDRVESVSQCCEIDKN